MDNNYKESINNTIELLNELSQDPICYARCKSNDDPFVRGRDALLSAELDRKIINIEDITEYSLEMQIRFRDLSEKNRKEQLCLTALEKLTNEETLALGIDVSREIGFGLKVECI